MNDLYGPYACYKIISGADQKPEDCEFLEVNPAFERMTGLKKGDLAGKRLLEFFPEIGANGENWLEIFGRVAMNGKREVFEYHAKPFNKWFLVQVNSVKKGFFSTYYADITALYTDITALKKREAALTRTNNQLALACEQAVISENKLQKQLDEFRKNLDLERNRYWTIVEESNDMIYCCTISGQLTSANKSFCRAVDKPAAEIIGKNIADFLQFEDAGIAWNNFLLKGVIESTRQAEHTFIATDGSRQYHQVTLAPIFDVHQQIIEVVVTSHDITAIKQNEQKIMIRAYRDPLTDLPNRNLFFDRLCTSIATHRRTGAKGAVILVDLDEFIKHKNTLGNEAANKIIIETAKKLVSCMRDYDTVARSGENDDSFLLLFQNIRHNNELFPIINRIKASLDKPFVIDDKTQVSITASLGISVFPDDGTKPEEILVNVDKAMYMAKELGRNRYHFYNDGLKEELERKTKLEAMLNNAIANQEFELYYQPQYEARTRKLRGFEALLRWNNPEVGLVMPMEFIPPAEETGMIVPIGAWVIDTACRLCNKVNKTFDLNLTVSVNISPVQLKKRGFYESVIRSVREAGLEMSNLELEITESAFSEKDNINNVLQLLKEEGVQITLTDFGTGNLSLSDLKRLPVNMVKLGKEFVHEIDHSDHQDVLADSIISLMHKMDIKLIASGVENIKQLDYLLRGECDNIQGYFFEEPVPETMIEDFIRKGGLEKETLSRVLQMAGPTYEGFVKREIVRIGKMWDSKL